MSGNAVQFHYAARSDVGLVRSNNQDSGYAGANLLVLADGMGGPAGGDIASSVALAHLVPLDTDSHPADSMLPLLREALLDAHEELTDRSSRDRDLEGLGTTCIALMRSGNRLAMVHIGDSRAYVLRGDTLTQVTTDHSFVQYLVDTGQITPEEAEHHQCAEELIRLALLGGGPDNITCVIADIVPAGTYPPAPPQIVGAAAIDRNAKSRGGEGAAARAAALGSSSSGTPSDEDEAPIELKPRSSWWTPVFISLVTVLVVAASWMSWKWTQTQYYAIGQDGYVVIYQGIPQSIGPWQLSHAVEVSSVSLADLSPVDRQRLDTPVLRSSRADIDSYIEGLKRSAAENAASSSSSSSSSTPQSGTSQSGASQSGAQSGGAS